jgi:hypothetical protein
MSARRSAADMTQGSGRRRPDVDREHASRGEKNGERTYSSSNACSAYDPSRLTSATATSPTICRLAPLTLSIVSPVVCQGG